MATVDMQINPGEAVFLAASGAYPIITAGTNFPVEGIAFPDALNAAFFKRVIKQYGSGNLTLDIDWYADTATSGNIIFGASLAAITPDTDSQDVETKAFATENTVTDSHLGTTGQRVHRCSIVISNLDGLVTGDDVWLRLQRRGADGGDTLSGIAIVIALNLSYSDT